jgi:hypothetical protein
VPIQQESKPGNLPDSMQLFDWANQLADYYATDPQTLSGVRVESFPVAVRDGSVFSGYVPIVAGSLVVEYSTGSNYRMSGAQVDVGLIESDFEWPTVENGTDWKESVFVDSVKTFLSTVEVDNGLTFPALREAILDREKGTRELTEDGIIELRRHGQSLGIDGIARIAKMYEQVLSSRRGYSKIERSRSQSIDDFKSISSFIGSVGVGLIVVNNKVPVSVGERVDLVDITQTTRFSLPERPEDLNFENCYGPYATREVLIDPEYLHALRIEEWSNGHRVSTIGTEEHVADTLTGLQLCQSQTESDRDHLFNTRLTQQHAKRFIEKIQSMV